VYFRTFGGSDVAGMRNAVKRNKYYVLNGSKTFITNGVYADYCCQNRLESGNKGISIFLVDKTEGISANLIS
jgi:alkylation response protein AidB-like acyl-CoA dehydrogenase